MPALPDDPELAAAFRAEVEERLSSLSSGLLALEASIGPADRGRPLNRGDVAALFRDAHTIKGSARLLGVERMVRIAHAAEDLLGAVRDGRVPLRPELVDLLLAACDGLARTGPGADPDLPDAQVEALVSTLRSFAPSSSGAAFRRAAPVPRQRATSGRTAAPADQAASAAPVATPAAPAPPAAAPRSPAAEVIRVGTEKVLGLIEIVGETEVEAHRLEAQVASCEADAQRVTAAIRALRARLDAALAAPEITAGIARVSAEADLLGGSFQQLKELAEDHSAQMARLRDASAGLVMVPMRHLTDRFPRLVRDVSRRSGKRVRLAVEGGDVELDKQVLEAASEALAHLVTNAVDHGCETPAVRQAAGKPDEATVTVRVSSAGGTVRVDVTDDGRGIDREALRAAAVRAGVLTPDAALTDEAVPIALFAPAVSTAGAVTETSGRGVGLDAAHTAVEALGGALTVSTQAGLGTTFTVILPVTLGVLRCVLARVGGELYAVPVASVSRTLSLRGRPRHDLAGTPTVLDEGGLLPLHDLGAALGQPACAGPRNGALVVRVGERELGWAVDILTGESELVIKELPGFLADRLCPITGATIRGDGTVVCVLDLRELTMSALRAPAPARATPGDGPAPDTADRPAGPRRVLVVEDSVGVRELERAVLTAAGYAVDTAVDGLEAAARLSGPPYALVLTDIEMPRLDGFALTRRLRATPGWQHVPVVVMTSRGSDEDRRTGLEAGADAYLLKSDFDQADLLATVRRLVGA